MLNFQFLTILSGLGGKQTVGYWIKNTESAVPERVYDPLEGSKSPYFLL